MNIELRRKAIKLRQKGMTFTDIRKALQIPKSTLSDWLKGSILSHSALKVLTQKRHHSREIAMEKTRLTKQRKREERFKRILKEAKLKLLPVTKRELYLAGLLLYLGEGAKGDNSTVSLNNTDPTVVKFYYYWLTHALNIKKEKVRVALHLYEDMNISESIMYWHKYLSIPKTQFIKPYIKKSFRKEIDQRGFGHGTCGIYVYDRIVKLQILAGMSAITGMI